METISLAEMTDRLKHERAKDAENTPAARFGRGIQSESVQHYTVEGVREVMNPTPKAVETSIIKEVPVPVRDYTQHQLRPAGYSLGHGPQIAGELGPSMTSKQAMLNIWHARQAHEADARGPETPTATVDKPAQQITSNMRPIQTTAGVRPFDRLTERDDDDRGR